MPSSEDKDVDVLPAWANQGMAVLWILLFGGRWIAVPFLNVAGVVSPKQVELLDVLVLEKCYLILFALTMVVLALRLVRAPRSVQVVADIVVSGGKSEEISEEVEPEPEPAVPDSFAGSIQEP